MIIMTGTTVNNNSAIKAADDHGIRLITIKRWESISQFFRLMLLKYVFVSTITYPQNFSSGAWYRTMYNVYHQ